MDPMLLQLLRGMAAKASANARGVQGQYDDAQKLLAQRAAEASRARGLVNRAARAQQGAAQRVRVAQSRLNTAQRVAQARLAQLNAAATPQQRHARQAMFAHAVGRLRTAQLQRQGALGTLGTAAAATRAAQAKSAQAAAAVTRASANAANLSGPAAGAAAAAGMGNAAVAVASFAAAIIDAAKKAKQFSDSVSQEVAQIGRFNASIQFQGWLTNLAQAAADRTTAKGVAPLNKEFQESRRERIKATRPIEEAWEKAKIRVAKGLEDTATDLANAATADTAGERLSGLGKVAVKTFANSTGINAAIVFAKALCPFLK